MTVKYEDRVQKRLADGTWAFQDESDARHEDWVAAAVSKAWGVTVHRYPALYPVDFFIEKDKRMVGLMELKSRSFESTKYPTTFLNYQKYRYLMESELLSVPVPAYFAVSFSDGLIYYTRITDVAAMNVSVIHAATRQGYSRDTNPVIEVPISSMKLLTKEVSRG